MFQKIFLPTKCVWTFPTINPETVPILVGGLNPTMTISCPSPCQGATVAQRVQAARNLIAQRLAELKKQSAETLFLVSLARVRWFIQRVIPKITCFNPNCYKWHYHQISDCQEGLNNCQQSMGPSACYSGNLGLRRFSPLVRVTRSSPQAGDSTQ